MIVKTTKLERSIEDAKDDEMHEFYKKNFMIYELKLIAKSFGLWKIANNFGINFL